MTELSRPAAGQRAPLLLVLLLLAAAAPVRFGYGLPLVGSVSFLDVMTGVVGLALAARVLHERRLQVGYPLLFGLLCVPFLAAVVSLLWSQDPSTTLREILSLLQGLLLYLYAVGATERAGAEGTLRWLRRSVYLLLAPPVLMLVGVPGFQPQEPGVAATSVDYIGYFTRLSHPFIGRSNNLASVLAFFPFVLAWWGMHRGDRRASRAAVVAVAAIALTLSRGVLGSLLLGTVLYLLVARPPIGLLARRTVSLGLLLGLAGALFLAFNTQARELLDTRLQAASIEDRTALVELALEKIEQRPVVGYGGGVTPEAEPALEAGVHNTYVQQLLSYGAPLGLLVIASLGLTSVFFLCRHKPGTPARAIGFTLLVQLLVFGSQSSFEGVVVRAIFFLFVGVVTGLLQEEERRSAAPPPLPSRDGAR